MPERLAGVREVVTEPTPPLTTMREMAWLDDQLPPLEVPWVIDTTLLFPEGLENE